MNYFLTTALKVAVGNNVLDVKDKLAHLLGIAPRDILSVQLHKQSIDARDKQNVHFVCSYLVGSNKTLVKNARPFLPPQNLLQRNAAPATGKSCIVVGSGPAGLFVARYLCLCGVKVTVVEQGSDVQRRAQVVQRYFDGGELDEKCNVQFGLGGAGTFSDGKLTTGISSPLLHTVFSEFVACGAPNCITTDAMPHVGTDNLQNVVANMRSQIQQSGGTFLFDTTVCDIITRSGRAVGVQIQQNGTTQNLFADCIALCTGNSARQLFSLLNQFGAVQFKPFAVGLRVEHTRDFVNTTQYGTVFATHRDLPAATYKLVHNMGSNSCYSFCMCPGGVVVAANSQRNAVVVNGMSNSARNAPNSNSALVVTVTAQDIRQFGFGDDALCGMRFQQWLEEEAYKWGGGNYKAPCQNTADFLDDKTSVNYALAPSYPRGTTPVNFNNLLPPKIVQALKQSLQVFNNKMKNFAACGVLSGVETRTSSPVRILRNPDTFQSSIAALFPIGEGAGYAGGIVSSAVDGLKAAQKIVEFLAN